MKRMWYRLRAVPFISIGLVNINVIFYVLNTLWNEKLLIMGNLNVYDVLIGKEYERIIFAMFLHADLNHLFNNMIILLFMVGLSLYNGFMSRNIDNAAHVGGLLAGFLLGCLFCVVQHVKYNMKKRGNKYDER